MKIDYNLYNEETLLAISLFATYAVLQILFLYIFYERYLLIKKNYFFVIFFFFIYSPMTLLSLYSVRHIDYLVNINSLYPFPLFNSNFFLITLILTTIIALAVIIYRLIKTRAPLITFRGNNKKLITYKILILTYVLIHSTIHIKGSLEIEQLEINKITISVKNLPKELEGYTIIQLTDLHASLYVTEEYLNDVMEKVNQLNGDIVVLTGDYITIDTNHIPPLMRALSRLKNLDRVFAIPGNHEYVAIPAFEKTFNDVGIRFLMNESIILRELNSKKLNLIGIEDLVEGKVNMNSAMKNCRDDDINILLSHHPDFVDQLPNYPIDVMLAGHTHGGVFHIPFYGAVSAPSEYGSKYALGKFEIGRATLFVSKGVGVNGLPIRFLCRPEIAVITLTKK